MMKAIKILGMEFVLRYETIQKYVESKGFSVVRDFCGHGVGKISPNVAKYFGIMENLTGETKNWNDFYHEPMINEVITV